MTPEQEAKVWKMNDERNKAELKNKDNIIAQLFTFVLLAGSVFIPYGTVGLWIIWLFYAAVTILLSIAIVIALSISTQEVSDALKKQNTNPLEYLLLAGHVGITLFHGWTVIAFLLVINSVFVAFLRYRK